LKKLTYLVSLVLMFSLPLTAFADGFEKEKEKEKESKKVPETTILYSGPIGGDEALTQPVNGEMTPSIVVSEGATFTWEYDETAYDSDKLVKNGYSWMTTALLGGTGSLTTYWLIKLFTSASAKVVAGGISGSLWARGVKDLPQTQFTYWTTKKYVDKDLLGEKTNQGFYCYPEPAYRKHGFLDGDDGK